MVTKKNKNMKVYSGFIIIGSETKSIELIADKVEQIDCVTKFLKRVQKFGDYGTPEVGYELVAQYPSDRLVIDSIEEYDK